MGEPANECCRRIAGGTCANGTNGSPGVSVVAGGAGAGVVARHIKGHAAGALPDGIASRAPHRAWKKWVQRLCWRSCAVPVGGSTCVRVGFLLR
jgi:hypothetical protein